MSAWIRLSMSSPNLKDVEKRIRIRFDSPLHLDTEKTGVDTKGYLELRPAGVVLKSREGGVRLSNRAAQGTEIILETGDVWSTPSFTIEFTSVPTHFDLERAAYEDDESDRTKRVVDFSISFSLVGIATECLAYVAWTHFHIFDQFHFSYPFGFGYVVGGVMTLFLAVILESRLKKQKPLLRWYRLLSGWIAAVEVLFFVVLRFGTNFPN